MRQYIIYNIHIVRISYIQNDGCQDIKSYTCTVYPKKYAHVFCFAVLCCGYILTDFPISIRLTSLALCQSNDCPSASKATLMNMDKYFMWIHYERLHNHNKAKHNKTVCIFLGINCMGCVVGAHSGISIPKLCTCKILKESMRRCYRWLFQRAASVGQNRS